MFLSIITVVASMAAVAIGFKAFRINFKKPEHNPNSRISVKMAQQIPRTIAPSSSSKGFAEVANLLVKDIAVKSVQFSDKNWFEGLSNSSVTNITVCSVPMTSNGANPTTCSVSSLVLPTGLRWSTFADFKQSEAQGTECIVLKNRRLVGEYPMSEMDIADILLKGRSVALIGHPGVGKSTEMNVVLIDLLNALHEGRIQSVFHRVKRTLYRYTIAELDGVQSIECEQVPDAGKSLDALTDFFLNDEPTHNPTAVLVVELEETERDPKWTIPTLLAMSSRDVLTELKTWDKAGKVIFSFRPTHTPEELLVLATALYQLPSRTQFLLDLGLTESTSSVEDVHRVVRQRMEIVGPLAREVLAPESKFVRWKEAMERAMGVEEFLNMPDTISKFSLPKTSKYYIAPNEYGELRFLSGHAIELVLSRARSFHRQTIAEIGYAWQAAEHIVKKFFVLNQARNGSAVCHAWNFNNWEFFVNPPPGRALSREYALNRTAKAAMISQIINHKYEVEFQGQMLHKRIEELDSQCVYSSSVHTMSVGEFFVVGAGRELILFQTSTVDPSKHTISLAELRKWVGAVKPEKIKIIFFTDWCEKTTKRVTVEDGTEVLSDSQVSSRLFGEGNTFSFESFIVRCGIYNSIKVRCNPVGEPRELRSLVRMYKEGNMNEEVIRKECNEWTVAQIKQLLRHHGEDVSDKASKADLVASVVKLVKKNLSMVE